jgi:hypothetical protein
VSLWTKLDRGLQGYERLGKLLGTTIVIVGAIVAAWVVFRDFLGEHSVGAWVPVVVGVPLLLLILVAYAIGRRHGGVPLTTSSTPSAALILRQLEQAVATVEYEKRLVWDALESIQQALATDEDWDLDQLVERGVLGPARGFLLREKQEDVRLSVLVPRDDAPDRFGMRWAAGHRPESVRNYDREIDKTMAGIAFRRGEFVECSNVRNDPRFEPNPKESRPFTSLVSAPLRINEQIVGAFTVVSTREDAFKPTDISFIKLIGALLDVLLAAEYDIARWEEEAEAMGRHPRRSIAPSPNEEEPSQD